MISLGLGLTNACNRSCAHCYRPDPPLQYLSLKSVRRVCQAVDVSGVNLGTGENGLHPHFDEILEYLLGRGLRVSLTSNGLSVAMLADEQLRRLHDVEVSLDFPDRARFDASRGRDAWSDVIEALERCARLGVPRTVSAVLMRPNHRDLAAVARLAAQMDAPLRVNAYQPVKWLRFSPSYDEFWWAITDLFEHTTVVACSEPVVCAAAGLENDGLRCGRTSLRIMPGGELLPCVYWPEAVGDVGDVAALGEELFQHPSFQHLHDTPHACVDCPLLPLCGGGCASRRKLAKGNLADPDPYCPQIGNIRLAKPQLANGGDRLHVGNVCTLLVRA